MVELAFVILLHITHRLLSFCDLPLGLMSKPLSQPLYHPHIQVLSRHNYRANNVASTSALVRIRRVGVRRAAYNVALKVV